MQYYNIKYPFRVDSNQGNFIDLNETIDDRVASEIAHVMLTRKGTRLRMPNFGTKLITYIFEPGDSMTWSDVEGDIKETVTRFVPDVMITKVNVVEDKQDDNAKYIDIEYQVSRGVSSENNRMVIKI